MTNQPLTESNESVDTISLFERIFFCTCYCACIHEYDFYVRSAYYAFNQAHLNAHLRFLIEALSQMLLLFKTLYDHVADLAFSRDFLKF